jgi:hypothetical protein
VGRVLHPGADRIAATLAVPCHLPHAEMRSRQVGITRAVTEPEMVAPAFRIVNPADVGWRNMLTIVGS